MRSPASWVHHLQLLVECAIWLSCVSQRRTWAYTWEDFNRSTNAASSWLRISPCCCWPPKNTDGRDVVNPRSRLNGLQSVDFWVDVLYAHSPSGIMVFNWPWWWMVKACGYWMTFLFQISDSLSICKWSIVNMINLVSNLLFMFTQKCDIQCMSLSPPISRGTRWSLMRPQRIPVHTARCEWSYSRVFIELG